MLDLVVLATTLWVCPGDVYSNEPREGCRPFHESNQEGFSTVPEPKPDPADNASSPSRPSNSLPEQRQEIPAASSRECALYEEWLTLNLKTDSIGAHDMSTDEFERWSNLKQMFSVTAPPMCSSRPNR
ncbi:MAG: hypothetical protein FJ246_00185 [Nitrospira sp.]|nr:hypothetical protein [Nitrospira sp.]